MPSACTDSMNAKVLNPTFMLLVMWLKEESIVSVSH